jgi:hypothetical protein
MEDLKLTVKDIMQTDVLNFDKDIENKLEIMLTHHPKAIEYFLGLR